MKFCVKCGKELMDEAVICIGCGCAVREEKTIVSKKTSGLNVAAKVFMVIGTVGNSWLSVFILFLTIVWNEPITVITLFLFLIPWALSWCLPMTIVYFKKTKKGEPIGVGFKICTLLFVNTIAGILMLCDNDK